MRTVTKMAVVDERKCNACCFCINICPVVAIHLEKRAGRSLAVVDETDCLDCKLCFTG